MHRDNHLVHHNRDTYRMKSPTNVPSFGIFGQASNSPYVFENTNKLGSNQFSCISGVAPSPFESLPKAGENCCNGQAFGNSNVFRSNLFGTTSRTTNSPFGLESGGNCFSCQSFGNSNISAPNFFGSTTPGNTNSPSRVEAGGDCYNGLSFGDSNISAPILFGTTACGTMHSTIGEKSSPSSGAFGKSSNGASIVGSTSNFGQTSDGNRNSFPFRPSVDTSPPTGGFGSSFGTTTGCFGVTPSFGCPTSHKKPSTPFGGFGQSSGFGHSSNNTSIFGQPTNSPSTFGISTYDGAAFGQSNFGFSGTQVPNRGTSYVATYEVGGGNGSEPAGKLQSISAMPLYSGKSHEELRFESMSGGKASGQPIGFASFSRPNVNNCFAPKSPFASNSFDYSAAKVTTPTFVITPFSFSHQREEGSRKAPYVSTPAIDNHNEYIQSISAMPINKGKSVEELRWEDYKSGDRGVTVNGGSMPLTSSFPTPSPFSFINSTPPDSLSPNLPPTPFPPKLPSFPMPFPNPPKTCPHCRKELNSSPSIVGPSPFFPLSNSNPSHQTPSIPTPLESTHTVETTKLESSPEVTIPSIPNQGPVLENTVIGQPMVNASPFGILPELTHLSISQPGSTISVQYGISNLPVVDKRSASVRLSSSLTSRHLSEHRIRLPARKCDSKSNVSRVPFFSQDDEEKPSASANIQIVPRALVTLSAEVWPQRSSTDETSPHMNTSLHKKEMGLSSETKKESNDAVNSDRSSEGTPRIDVIFHEPEFQPAAIEILKEEKDDICALLPQLSLSEYYTEPSIKELAAKERSEPGYCSHVKDFIIGHHSYGSIKFLGESDVRKLNLDSLVEFNNREVIVYKNGNEKPPVGQRLNKPAEVTLLKVKCIDKKKGGVFVDGPKVENYKELLIKKGKEEGAEFVSFDPVKGEWKFRVQHF